MIETMTQDQKEREAQIDEAALAKAKAAYEAVMGETPWKQGLMRAIQAYESARATPQAATAEARIAKAIAQLSDMIDGGEECRGRDSQISYVIDILEGRAA